MLSHARPQWKAALKTFSQLVAEGMHCSLD